MWRWWRRRRARAALYAAYERAAEADQEGRARIVELVESWDDDEHEPGPTEQRPRDRPVWNEVTRPLPLVDDRRPLMTRAGHWRADAARRRSA